MTDADKAALFAACRSGSVAMLVGSTEKMGVGTTGGMAPAQRSPGHVECISRRCFATFQTTLIRMQE